MKISLSWLKEYVDLPQNVTADKIAEKLTYAGLEVEAIEDQGMGLDKVFVGAVLEKRQHPNADRLSLTKVSVGKALGDEEKILHIVCGAQNIAKGQKVPVATIGAVIPDGLEIKLSKIRDETSEGMLCSPTELKINHPEGEKGIYILDNSAETGTPFAEYLGKNDVVFDLSITPDRGDALSHIGVARDLAALFDCKLKIPEPRLSEMESPCEVSITSEIPKHCPAYFVRYIEGVKVGPSPSWLRKRIEAIGLRSTNNVVDISTYVMFEIGQPIHTFDANTLVEDNRIKITIRDGKEGEEFLTISHRELNLNSNDIVIAAGEKEQITAAMAGVMGSNQTEVSDATSNILIESAIFDAARVRATSRNYTMLTDAAYRFERKVDPARLAWACDRTAELIVKVAGGKVGHRVENAEAKTALEVNTHTITVSLREITRLLGKAPEPATITKLIGRLGFGVKALGEEGFVFTVPTWRNDVHVAEDIIEEIIRLWGFDKLTSKLPEAFVKNETAVTVQERQLRTIRKLLTAWGFSEALNFTFTNMEAELLGLNNWLKASKSIDDEVIQKELDKDFVRLESPLGESFNLLRRDLLPGLVRNARLNASHRMHDIRFFEIRPTFHSVGPTKKSDPRTETLTKENLRLAFLAGGATIHEDWQGEKDSIHFYDMKGWLELVLGAFGKQSGVRFVKPDKVEEIPYHMHPGQTALLMQGNRPLGYVGQVHPYVCKQNDIRVNLYGADLDLNWALSFEERKHRFKTFGKFPNVERDFSATVAESISADNLRNTIKSSVKDLLRDIKFFDVYRGERIPKGHVSYAFRVVLGSDKGTLADKEVQDVQQKIISTLQDKYQAQFAGL